MNKDINSFEYFEEMTKDWNRLDLLRRCYDLCNKKVKIQQEIERLNNKEEQLIRRLEDLIIVGEQVENEWAVDICKMIIKELRGSDKN